MLIEEFANQTLFSLSDEAPGWFESSEPALGSVQVLRAGWLIVEGSRRSCLIRTITGGGAVVHGDVALRPGQIVSFQMGGAAPLGASVTWAEGSEAGLEFESPADVVAMIASDIAAQPDERRRMPRVGVHCFGRIQTAKGSCPITVRDVSQGGIRADLDGGSTLSRGDAVSLTIDGFRPLQGTIRWNDGISVGVAFDAELAWQELMPWLKLLRDRAVRRRPDRDPDESGATVAAPAAAGEPEQVGINILATIREGTMRWPVELVAISTHGVEFESFASPRVGTFLWVMLPGLEGWYAQIVSIDRYRFTCRFVHPLHPLVLQRIVDAARP